MVAGSTKSTRIPSDASHDAAEVTVGEILQQLAGLRCQVRQLAKSIPSQRSLTLPSRDHTPPTAPAPKREPPKATAALRTQRRISLVERKPEPSLSMSALTIPIRCRPRTTPSYPRWQSFEDLPPVCIAAIQGRRAATQESLWDFRAHAGRHLSFSAGSARDQSRRRARAGRRRDCVSPSPPQHCATRMARRLLSAGVSVNRLYEDPMAVSAALHRAPTQTSLRRSSGRRRESRRAMDGNQDLVRPAPPAVVYHVMPEWIPPPPGAAAAAPEAAAYWTPQGCYAPVWPSLTPPSRYDSLFDDYRRTAETEEQQQQQHHQLQRPAVSWNNIPTFESCQKEAHGLTPPARASPSALGDCLHEQQQQPHHHRSTRAGQPTRHEEPAIDARQALGEEALPAGRDTAGTSAAVEVPCDDWPAEGGRLACEASEGLACRATGRLSASAVAARARRARPLARVTRKLYQKHLCVGFTRLTTLRFASSLPFVRGDRGLDIKSNRTAETPAKESNFDRWRRKISTGVRRGA
ncbi:unnamed protein product [Vitrella brassicaformis CCMP3155]|uniref:Uncharacterized protein n=1 Tax=Vitrella brassicaformis (strain CCMP3155) TaxID=1169540 RepID=A0A0G4EPM2_VITBC|nr:unnamed protein product [Vitrella brassicaformis CCMP3155]|eukprot:CEL99390.1 unnamed protein product [Vitrella brassicaformis CCMP3155]